MTGNTTISTTVATFNATPDPAIYIGYNQNADGSLVNPQFDGYSFCVEGNYNDGASIKMEAYLQALFTDGTSVRPFFFQIDTATKQITGARIRASFANGLAIIAGDFTGSDAGQIQIAKFTKGNLQISPVAGMNGNLTISAPAGKCGILQLGYNGVDGYAQIAPSQNILQFCINGGMRAYLFASVQGQPGAAFAVGIQDNSAAGMFKSTQDNIKGLVARANSATQTANLLETQDASGNAVFSVTPQGMLVAPNLPTTDPHVNGAIWNTFGVLNVSSG